MAGVKTTIQLALELRAAAEALAVAVTRADLSADVCRDSYVIAKGQDANELLGEIKRLRRAISENLKP